MEVKDQVDFKDIIVTLKQLPKTLRLVLKLEKSLFVKILLISLITGVIPVISLFISQELINSIVRIQTDFKTVIQIFFIYIGVTFISEILSQISGYYNSKFQFHIGYKLNYIVMEKGSNLGLEDFENPKVYDKLERVTKEVAYKPYQIFQAIISLITASVTLISSILFLMVWNPTVSMLLLIIPIISLYYFLRIGQQEFYIQWKRAGEERKAWYLSYILTHDFSFKEIKIYNLKEYILESYRNLRKKFIAQDTKILQKKTAFNIVYEIVVQVIGAIVIILALLSAYAGKIMVGNVMSYIRSVGMVQGNSQRIMGNIYSIYHSNLYMNQLFEFLEYKKEHSLLENNAKEGISHIQSIELRDIKFRYNNNTMYSLEDINLNFKKGERVAIVGPNGSGKSTLIKLLSGLYEIQSGKILINGKSLKEIEQKSYMEEIAVLFQDYMKYEMTLQENIGFGRVDKIGNKKNMEIILDKVKAEFLKENSSYNLNMQLGLWFNEGRQLSGGQWQKIAIARAYFRDASLYIFDEPSSALDPIAERETFNTFFELSSSKIGIFISHRLVAAKLADRIIVMDEGKVVGEGNHEELLQSCPVYKRMNDSENYKSNLRSDKECQEVFQR